MTREEIGCCCTQYKKPESSNKEALNPGDAEGLNGMDNACVRFPSKGGHCGYKMFILNSRGD